MKRIIRLILSIAAMCLELTALCLFIFTKIEHLPTMLMGIGILVLSAANILAEKKKDDGSHDE